MNPNATPADNAVKDGDALSAPTSPWTDALHSAWTSEEAEQTTDEPSDGGDNPLMDAYL